MPSRSDTEKLNRANYGFARVRDVAFDAISDLWRRREAEGVKQKEIAEALGRDPGWVSKNLRGPGNWTLRTIGELVEVLGGEIVIKVYALEDPLESRDNYDAYLGYSETIRRFILRSDTSATAVAIRASSSSHELYFKASAA
jgi:transcriptional regulator with XRE-family HTH domain